MHVDIGQLLGGFRITERLWRGTLATCYRAIPYLAEVDSGDTESVLLRVLATDMFAGDEARARFERELDLLKRMGDSGGVLPILEWGMHRGTPWLAQERSEGQRLDKVLGSGAMPWKRAVGVAVDLAGALQTAHDLGVVVRELPPESVLVASDGRARLLDLGLVRATDRTQEGLQTAQGVRVGDPAYMAPEYITTQELSPASDVYSLGALLFEMLTGRPPFVGADYRVMMGHVSDLPPTVSSKVEVPAALEALVASALAKDPQDRPGSAAALATDLSATLL
jgi:serine/threonine protein kinase